VVRVRSSYEHLIVIVLILFFFFFFLIIACLLRGRRATDVTALSLDMIKVSVLLI